MLDYEPCESSRVILVTSINFAVKVTSLLFSFFGRNLHFTISYTYDFSMVWLLRKNHFCYAPVLHAWLHGSFHELTLFCILDWFTY